MKFATTMNEQEYQAPVESKQPSAPIESIGQVVRLPGNISEIQNGPNNTIDVISVASDPEKAAMITAKISYPTSKAGRFKLAELEKLQGSKIELVKEGNETFLSVDDKKLTGMEISQVWKATVAGDNAPTPGKPYWKLISLNLPKAAA